MHLRVNRKHEHRFFIDQGTNERVCLCGNTPGQKGEKKYHNNSTQYEGVTYHSAFEANYAGELDTRKRAKDLVSWERQVKISMDVCLECSRLVREKCGEHPAHRPLHLCNYYIDFVVHYKDDTEEYVEVKGMETDLWRMKWNMLEAILEKKVKSGEARLLLVKEQSYRNWMPKKKSGMVKSSKTTVLVDAAKKRKT